MNKEIRKALFGVALLTAALVWAGITYGWQMAAILFLLTWHVNVRRSAELKEVAQNTVDVINKTLRSK